MDLASRAEPNARDGSSANRPWHHRHGIWNRPLTVPSLVACPDCDFLQRIPEVPTGAAVRCRQCGKGLWRHKTDSLNRTLALSIAALALFVIANSVPMLGVNAVGRESFTTVAGGTQQLWQDGEKIVAVLVFFAAILSPALQIGLLLLITLGCGRPRPPFWVGVLLRHVQFFRTWSMIEVMLLGVLVALTKIAEIATIIPGLALFSLFGLVMLLAAMDSCFDPREVWERIEWANHKPHPVATEPEAQP